MPRWTDKQQNVIDHRGASLMVSAAAGSGKTAVMVQRILELILRDGADVERMLVVTFTNAAAAEMKERIAKALEGAMRERPEEAARLRSQLDRLEDAAISTLHTFCNTLLHRYYSLVDLDPGFRLAAGEETDLMWQEAREDAMEALLEEKDPDFMAAMDCWGGREGNDMAQSVRRAYTYAMARPDGVGALERALETFIRTAEEPTGSPAYRYSLDRCIQILEHARELTRQALAITGEPDGPTPYTDALESDLRCIEAAIAALAEGAEAASVALSFGFAALSRKKGGSEELREAVKALRDKVKEHVKKARETVDAAAEGGERLLPMIPPLRGLVRAVARTAEAYAREKSLRGVLDFNDLEHRALDVLEVSAVRDELRDRYAYVFVDEYQDTNGVQEAIVTSVAREDNLFCVGDVKQSIYRFRQADPSIFLKRYDRSSPIGEGISQKIDLNRNFRSHPGILEGINALFSRIMSPQLGDIVYDADAALYPGAPRPEPEDAEPAVRLELFRQPDGEESELRELTKLEAQAVRAADMIAERMTRPMWDGKAGAYRPARYGDFAILLRVVRGKAAVVADVLRARGIPVVADGGEGYYDQIEVAQVLDCLAWIDHRERDLPLIHVLHSGMGRFTMEELYRVRRAYPEEDSFCRAAARYAAEAEDELSGRLGAFLTRGEAWRDHARHATVEEVIWQVLEDTGFYEWVGALPGGDVRQGNLRLLCRKARSLQDTWGRSLYGFLSHVERVRSTQTRLAEAQLAQEQGAMVQVLTVHRSKGLEYPVVFMMDLDSRINVSDSQEDILLHDELGIAARTYYRKARVRTPNMQYRAAAACIRQENLSEAMRVLYVAMTRPREQLILMGCLPREEAMRRWAEPITAYSLSSGEVTLMDWIAPVAARVAGGEELAELCGCEERIPLAYPWSVALRDRPRPSADAEPMARVMDAVRAALISAPDAALQAAYAWRYPYPSRPAAGKTTATAILKASQERQEVNFAWRELPEPMPRGEAGSALERGTWTHTLLEALRPGMGSAEQALEDLIAGGILPEEARRGVDIAGANAFLRDPLCGRIAAAEYVLREQPFVLETEPDEAGGDPVLIQGVIDLAFLEAGGWVLVDYKTNRIRPGEEDELLAWYRPQLQVYRAALEKLTRRPVKAMGLYLTRLGKTVWEE